MSSYYSWERGKVYLTDKARGRSRLFVFLGECPRFEKVFGVALAEFGFVGEIFVAVLFVLEVLVVFEGCYSL